MGTGTCQHTPSTQQPPRGTPQLLDTGKGLLFPGETEVRVGWADTKIAHPRSLKGTGMGMQAAQDLRPSLPLCRGRGHRAVTHLGMFGHTWAPTPVSAHAPCQAHPHTYTSAPPHQPDTTRSDKPLTCHLRGLFRSPCPQPGTHTKITPLYCGPPPHAHNSPKPRASSAGSKLCQRVLPRELSLGGCMSGVVCPLAQPPKSPRIIRDVTEGSESRSKSSTSPAPNPHPESWRTGTGIRTGTH